MKTSHRINSACIYYSLKYWMRFIYSMPMFMILSIPFAYYVKGWDWDRSIAGAPFLMVLSMFFFFTLPTFIIHLFHYYSSRMGVVEINWDEHKVTFKAKAVYTYPLADLRTELHTPIYHKNKIDGAKRWVTPWSNYSFLKIQTPDDREFNISSIIIKPHEFPIKPERTKYSLLPYIDSWTIDHSITKAAKQVAERDKIDTWKEKFSGLTIIQIEQKLQDGRLDDYPLKALMELKKEKSNYNH